MKTYRRKDDFRSHWFRARGSRVLNSILAFANDSPSWYMGALADFRFLEKIRNAQSNNLIGANFLALWMFCIVPSGTGRSNGAMGRNCRNSRQEDESHC